MKVFQLPLFWHPKEVWHSVKVRPGPQDSGSWDPETQHLGPLSKFKSGIPEPPPKFKNWTSRFHHSFMKSFFPFFPDILSIFFLLQFF